MELFVEEKFFRQGMYGDDTIEKQSRLHQTQVSEGSNVYI